MSTTETITSRPHLPSPQWLADFPGYSLCDRCREPIPYRPGDYADPHRCAMLCRYCLDALVDGR